jgi:hypothetical protein
VVIFITLLAGFVPLLQVTFFALLGDYLSGLTRCERSGQNSEDHRRDPYHVVSDYWVYHDEYFRLLICGLSLLDSFQISLVVHEGKKEGRADCIGG